MRKPKSHVAPAEPAFPAEPPAAALAEAETGLLPGVRRRDGSNALPRPRPRRPAAVEAAQAAAAGSAYRRAEVEEMFRRFRVQRPSPKSELSFANPFTLLVAVVLSAQATDASVNVATGPLFAVADTPEKMAALGEDEIGRFIRKIGLWRAKAKNVAALSEALIRDHGGAVPQTEAELVRLPGVGRKTANVVRNNAFGHPTMGVDTHIFRIGNRILLAPGKTPDQVERGLLAVIPERFLSNAHHWLILHGRYVCKARRPECERCVIADLCKSPEKTNSAPAPLVPIA